MRLFGVLTSISFTKSEMMRDYYLKTSVRGIYELPRELSNNLRLTILENQEKLGKYLNFTK